MDNAQKCRLSDDCLALLPLPLLCREAFAAWLPPLGVPLSYAVAISYVLVDTYDKGQRAYKSAERELGSRASLHPEVNTNRCVESKCLMNLFIIQL